jgi:hypothetical protein
MKVHAAPKLSSLWLEKKTVLQKVDFIMLETSFKEVYDKLLSLEAKIEVINQLIEVYKIPTMANDLPEWINNTMYLKIDELESEYQSLGKQHNLL